MHKRKRDTSTNHCFAFRERFMINTTPFQNPIQCSLWFFFTRAQIIAIFDPILAVDFSILLIPNFGSPLPFLSYLILFHSFIQFISIIFRSKITSLTPKNSKSLHCRLSFKPDLARNLLKYIVHFILVSLDLTDCTVSKQILCTLWLLRKNSS